MQYQQPKQKLKDTGYLGMRRKPVQQPKHQLMTASSNEDKQPAFDHNSCPYCKSKNIQKGVTNDLCRNCHRHFTG